LNPRDGFGGMGPRAEKRGRTKKGENGGGTRALYLGSSPEKRKKDKGKRGGASSKFSRAKVKRGEKNKATQTDGPSRLDNDQEKSHGRETEKDQGGGTNPKNHKEETTKGVQLWARPAEVVTIVGCMRERKKAGVK